MSILDTAVTMSHTKQWVNGS